jgi:hypothetical protein
VGSELPQEDDPVKPMSARSLKMAEKKLDAEISALYYANCNNVMIPMMEIPKIFKAAKAAKAEGKCMKEAIVAYVEGVRV